MSDFHNNFYQARVHRAKYEFDLAEEFCAKALEFDPQHVGALSLFGDIKAIQGHHPKAREAFIAAAKIEPENTVLLLNLATALKGMGDFDAARDLLEKAIAIDRSFAPAYYTLAGIVRFKAADPLIADFERLKKKVYGNSVYRCVACFALGKIYNDIGEWDLAFENYAEGNQRRRTRYDGAHTRNSLEAVKRFFTADLIRAREQFGNPSSKPVFIVGMPRSGSSLIEDILSRSNDVDGLGEPQYIEDLFYSAYKEISAPDKSVNLEQVLGDAEFSSLGDRYLKIAQEVAPGAKRLIDKNLFNHASIGFIRLVFPNASIIHATRDPIDSCVSCFFQNFTGGHDYSFDLGDIGRQYAAYDDIMKYWDNIFGPEIFSAPYEHMIADKDAAIADLFAHIKMPTPGEETLTKPANRAIPTASAWQARQPIYTTSVKRWKNYEKHLSPLFDALEQSGFHYTDT